MGGVMLSSDDGHCRFLVSCKTLLICVLLGTKATA